MLDIHFVIVLQLLLFSLYILTLIIFPSGDSDPSSVTPSFTRNKRFLKAFLVPAEGLRTEGIICCTDCEAL